MEGGLFPSVFICLGQVVEQEELNMTRQGDCQKLTDELVRREGGRRRGREGGPVGGGRERPMGKGGRV